MWHDRGEQGRDGADGRSRREVGRHDPAELVWLGRTLRPQILLAITALALGILIFALTVSAMALGNFGVIPAAAGIRVDVLLTVLAGAGAASVIGAWLIRRAGLRRARRLWEAGEPREQVESAWLMPLIPAGAVLESVGLLGCVFFLLSGEWWMLLGAGASVAGLAALAPTTPRTESVWRKIAGEGWEGQK